MGSLRLTVVDGSQARSPDPERESTGRLDPLIGSVIAGRFRIEKLLASGGMGRVYLATQESIDRPVALKVILHDEGSNIPEAKAVERFQLEATILARLQHPNIVTLHDFGEIEGAFHGRSYLVMELLEGRSLGAIFDEGHRLTPRRAVAIGAQIARALTYAHQRGVVHRDLKPANIVIVRDESGEELVKLVDFGVGKVEDLGAPKRGLTRTGAVLGTIGYMAPEQLYGIVSPAIDLYALGVVLFESLTGRLPCDDALLGDDLQLDAPPLALVAPELALPDGFGALVADLLARFADARPTAAQALDRLTECARTLEATPESPAPRSAGGRLANVPCAGARGASRAGFTSKGTAPELRVITSTVPPPLRGRQAAMASSPAPAPSKPLPLLSIAPSTPRAPAPAAGAAPSSLAPPARRGSRVVAVLTGRVPLAIVLAWGVVLAIAFSRGGLERHPSPAPPSLVPVAATAAALAAPASAAPTVAVPAAPALAPAAAARVEPASSARVEPASSARASAPSSPAEGSRAPSSPSALASAEVPPASSAAASAAPAPTPTASATVFSTSKAETAP